MAAEILHPPIISSVKLMWPSDANWLDGVGCGHFRISVRWSPTADGKQQSVFGPNRSCNIESKMQWQWFAIWLCKQRPNCISGARLVWFRNSRAHVKRLDSINFYVSLNRNTSMSERLKTNFAGMPIFDNANFENIKKNLIWCILLLWNGCIKHYYILNYVVPLKTINDLFILRVIFIFIWSYIHMNNILYFCFYICMLTNHIWWSVIHAFFANWCMYSLYS